MSVEKTHCRLLTPMGAGAIAVVRLEGPDAASLAGQLLEPNNAALTWIQSCNVPTPLAPTRLFYGRIIVDGELLDDAIVNLGRAADGNMRVDFCVHGGKRIVQRMIMALQSLGASPAGPDHAAPVWPAHNLIDADAVLRIEQAQTRRAVSFILRQREQLPRELERIAAQADSDERGAAEALAGLVGRSKPSKALVDGAVVAIVGPPNVGKSTLANRLFGAPRSIVTPVAGTTRDWVAEPTAVRGIPITLVDTPGVRATSDALEALAVRRSTDRWASCDLTLIVLDGSVGPPLSPADFCRNVPDTAAIVVVNKIDLPPAFRLGDLVVPTCWPTIALSAKTGQGLDQLDACIEKTLGLSDFDMAGGMLFCQRQFDMLGDCSKRHPYPGDHAAGTGANLAENIRNNLLGAFWRSHGPARK